MEESNISRLRGADIGYLTIDLHGTVRSCNEKAAAILNREYTQLLDSKLIAVLAADKRFQKLHDRLDRGLHLLKNEELQLANFRPGHNEGLTARIVTLPDSNGKIVGAYIGLIDDSEAVTARALVLDSIVEGVFTVDEQMNITSFNASAERMTGWTQEEVLGQPCKTIFKSNICDVSCAVSNSTRNNSNVCYDNDIYITKKSGVTFPVSVSATPLVDTNNNIVGGVETFRDISESVKNGLIISAVADGVVTFDDKGIITSFNNGAERITGWLETEVVGRVCDELFFGADDATACPITAASQGEPCNIIDQDGYVTDKDGYNIPISVSITPMLDDQKRAIGCVQTFRDNTANLQNKL
ncbi:MAG: PAS domain-containing protein, partial [Desulfobacterales bacterium]|nr:PAS domain-containing protein [Desulfobacterales bacterium]